MQISVQAGMVPQWEPHSSRIPGSILSSGYFLCGVSHSAKWIGYEILMIVNKIR